MLLWIGIALTWAVSVPLELALLGDRAPLAMAITTTLALIIGVQVTRRAIAPHRRARITVRDLRARRLPGG